MALQPLHPPGSPHDPSARQIVPPPHVKLPSCHAPSPTGLRFPAWHGDSTLPEWPESQLPHRAFLTQAPYCKGKPLPAKAWRQWPRQLSHVSLSLLLVFPTFFYLEPVVVNDSEVTISQRVSFKQGNTDIYTRQVPKQHPEHNSTSTILQLFVVKQLNNPVLTTLDQ